MEAMKHFDVVVVGAGTTGCYFAHEMATRGNTVLVLEASAAEQLGAQYGICHIAAADFERFGIPSPREKDDFAFDFSEIENRSASGRYAKRTRSRVIGMRRRRYLMRLNLWAMEAGADILYEAPYNGLVLDEKGYVSGVRYIWRGEVRQVSTHLVADCSGSGAAVRCSLPANFGIENKPLSSEDLLYIHLHYIRWQEPDHAARPSRRWIYYKVQEVPDDTSSGAILGVKANFSAHYAEKLFEAFQEKIRLAPYTVVYTERGVAPCRRPPYSMVGDGVLIMGDAACLTKPFSGEGVSSSLAQAKIAVDVIDPILKRGGSLTRAELWPVNTRYYAGQGSAFAAQRAILAVTAGLNAKENEFFFQHNILFNDSFFQALTRDKKLAYTRRERFHMTLSLLSGIFSRQVRLGTLFRLRRALRGIERLSALYADYPQTPADFRTWKTRADETWSHIPSMADAAQRADARGSAPLTPASL